MANNKQQAANWDWLANPNAALELYSSERRAYYNWQLVQREWSAATSQIEPSDRGTLTKEEQESLEALRKRLDEAARNYEQARKLLHDAWSA